MVEPIRARYDWNPDEWVKAQAAHRRHARGPIGRVVVGIALAILALVSVVAPTYFLITSGPLDSSDRRDLITMIGLFAFFWVFLATLLWSQGTRRWVGERAFKNIPKEARFVEWTFNADEISNRTGMTASSFRWPLFLKVVESPKGFLLYQNTNFFNWIPGSGFDSDLAVRAFSNLARDQARQFFVVGECHHVGKPEPLAIDDL